jgi:hypothetical protein
MGTNYFLHENVCEYCGHGDERLHIGKSSGGWCFSLHVEPGDDEHPQSLDDWRKRWARPGARIVDEYGIPIGPDRMLAVITERGSNKPREQIPYGYRSWADFYRDNHATEGPRGLVRHSLGSGICVGHGEGTWDLIKGEFF